MDSTTTEASRQAKATGAKAVPAGRGRSGDTEEIPELSEVTPWAQPVEGSKESVTDKRRESTMPTATGGPSKPASLPAMTNSSFDVPMLAAQQVRASTPASSGGGTKEQTTRSAMGLGQKEAEVPSGCAEGVEGTTECVSDKSS
jgi:hypothetical protein